MRLRTFAPFSGDMIRNPLLAADPGGEENAALTGGRGPWPVILAGAQRAPGLLIVVDRMPAHA